MGYDRQVNLKAAILGGDGYEDTLTAQAWPNTAFRTICGADPAPL